MTMMQKLRAKKRRRRKGFTLVELVIVIAILSILAAIAIPVITTTINSARISVLKSDVATLNMVIKECINTSKVYLETSLYNGKTAMEAQVIDVCIENQIGQSGKYRISENADEDTYFVRTIGNVEYRIVFTNYFSVDLWDTSTPIPSKGFKYNPLSADLYIKDLEP